MVVPSYLALYRNGELDKRIEKSLALLKPCRLCPRQCKTDRLADKRGYCKTGRRAKVAGANAHFGEEAPLVGRSGSGTIFFSSCNLLCSFCQNYDVSHYNQGHEIEPARLAAMMVGLADSGCHNINFVTPTHVIPQILEALPIAIEQGLHVPLVYNCGGYDSVETLKLLDGVFDIYMPDFKFWEERWADLFCEAPDYGPVARAALKEMQRQVGELMTNKSGITERGLLVRHLVMPNGVAGTKDVMTFLAQELSPRTYVNVMSQYRPCYIAASDPKLKRRISRSEHEQALEWAREAGLTRLDNRRPRRLF